MDKRLSDRLSGSGGLTQYVTDEEVGDSIEDSRVYDIIYNDYTVTNPHGEDLLVDVSNGAVEITLCDCPVDGATVSIGVSGDVTEHNLVVTGDTNLIEGGTSYTLELADSSLKLVYSGEQWEALKGESSFTYVTNNFTGDQILDAVPMVGGTYLHVDDPIKYKSFNELYASEGLGGDDTIEFNDVNPTYKTGIIDVSDLVATLPSNATHIHLKVLMDLNITPLCGLNSAIIFNIDSSEKGASDVALDDNTTLFQDIVNRSTYTDPETLEQCVQISEVFEIPESGYLRWIIYPGEGYNTNDGRLDPINNPVDNSGWGDGLQVRPRIYATGFTLKENAVVDNGFGGVAGSTTVGVEPIFLDSPHRFINTSGTTGWTIKDTSGIIPEGVRTVILQARGFISSPDGGDTTADVWIRKDNASPSLHLVTGRAAGDGDNVGTSNQGQYPIADDGTFQFLVQTPGFNSNVQVYIVGYYGLAVNPTTISDTYSTKQVVGWCDMTIGNGTATIHDKSDSVLTVASTGGNGNSYRLSMQAGTVANNKYYVSMTGGSFDSGDEGGSSVYGSFAYSRGTMTDTQFDFVVGDPDSGQNLTAQRFQIMIFDDVDIYKHILNGLEEVVESTVIGVPTVKRLTEYLGGEGTGNSASVDGLAYINNRDEIVVIGDASNNKYGYGVTDVDSPGTIIPLPPGIADIPVKLYMNESFNMLVLTDLGNVYSTGLNAHGQLSHVGTFSNSVGRLTKCTVTNVKKVVQGDHKCRTFGYLTNNGNLYIAGKNQYGQIGDGTQTNRTTGAYLSLSGVKDAISCGSYNGDNDVQSFIALMNDGTVKTVGYGGQGIIGNGAQNNTNKNWHTVDFGTPVTITEIQCSGGDARGTVVAKDSTGRLWGWGANIYGELGLNHKNEQRSPIEIASSVSDYWIQGGYPRVFYKNTSDKIYMSGNNANGKGGIGTESDVKVFNEVTSLSGKSVTAMFGYGGTESNGGTTVAVTSGRATYVAGRQDDGETGIGYRSGTPQKTFTKMWGAINDTDLVHSSYNTVPMVFIEYQSGGRTYVVSDTGELYGVGNSRWKILTFKGDDIAFPVRVNLM